jgi:SAM-dependent methyltransferase
MSFKDHFSGLAAQYSAFRPSYPPVLFNYLAQMCRERKQAWDCACGNGQATVALAKHFAAVIATDASPQQLSAAPSLGNVTYRVAPAEASGIDSSSVDLVTVAQALHWFDLDSFYGEAQRVLVPSGVMAAWSYGALHVEGAGIDALVQEFYSDIVGPYWPPRTADRRGRLSGTGVSFCGACSSVIQHGGKVGACAFARLFAQLVGDRPLCRGPGGRSRRGAGEKARARLGRRRLGPQGHVASRHARGTQAMMMQRTQRQSMLPMDETSG